MEVASDIEGEPLIHTRGNRNNFWRLWNYFTFNNRNRESSNEEATLGSRIRDNNELLSPPPPSSSSLSNSHDIDLECQAGMPSCDQLETIIEINSNEETLTLAEGNKSASTSMSKSTSTSEKNMSRSQSLNSKKSENGLLCLICLQAFTNEEFESGKAMTLDCNCRGELALRHKACAIQWINTKGNLKCDVCGEDIKNLPEPEPSPETMSEGSDRYGLVFADGNNTNGMYILDSIRMIWIVMIICTLFFDFRIIPAFVLGLVMTAIYIFFCHLNHHVRFRFLSYLSQTEERGGLNRENIEEGSDNQQQSQQQSQQQQQ